MSILRPVIGYKCFGSNEQQIGELMLICFGSNEQQIGELMLICFGSNEQQIGELMLACFGSNEQKMGSLCCSFAPNGGCRVERSPMLILVACFCDCVATLFNEALQLLLDLCLFLLQTSKLCCHIRKVQPISVSIFLLTDGSMCQCAKTVLYSATCIFFY